MSVPHVPKSTLSDKLLSGAVAGVIGTSIIFPIDLIKTKLQSSNSRARMSAVFRDIYNRQGFRGFYSGLIPNLIGTAILNLGVTPEKAIKLAVNDGLREMFASRSHIHPDRHAYINADFRFNMAFSRGPEPAFVK